MCSREEVCGELEHERTLAGERTLQETCETSVRWTLSNCPHNATQELKFRPVLSRMVNNDVPSLDAVMCVQV